MRNVSKINQPGNENKLIKVIVFTGFLSLVPSLFACGGISVLDVDYFRAPCSSVVSSMCLRDRPEDSLTWNSRIIAIEGFQPEWGKNYKIAIEDAESDAPLTDHPDSELKLVEILSEKQVSAGTNFAVTMFRSQVPGIEQPYFEKIDELDSSRWQTSDQQSFTCSNPSVCTKLTHAIEANQTKRLKFEIQPDRTIVLTTVEWLP